MENAITIQMEYHNGTLSVIDKDKYKIFIDTLEEGQRVEVFINTINSTKSLSQLAKVHKMIRVLAQDTGTTFDYMKKLVKDRAGLKVENEYKSFGDCSKDELANTIEVLKELYEFNGLIYNN